MAKTFMTIEITKAEIVQHASAAGYFIQQQIDAKAPMAEVFRAISLSSIGWFVGMALHDNVAAVRVLLEQTKREVDFVEKVLLTKEFRASVPSMEDIARAAVDLAESDIDPSELVEDDEDLDDEDIEDEDEDDADADEEDFFEDEDDDWETALEEIYGEGVEHVLLQAEAAEGYLPRRPINDA